MIQQWNMETTILVVSLAIIPVLAVLVLICLKIKISKGDADLGGLEGTVKKKNPDDSLKANSSSNAHDESFQTGGAASDSSFVKTPTYDRKLPEIPSDVSETYRGGGSVRDDNNSELYATVDEASGAALAPPPTRAEIGRGGLDDDDPANHPYAKVKKHRRRGEHPYAKVGEKLADSSTVVQPNDDDESETEEYDSAENLLLESLPAGSRGSSGRSANEPSSRAGGWASGRRRPDDTVAVPPLIHSRQATPLPPEPSQQQQSGNHFSGDSQDSMSKGYTVLSVREPLHYVRPQGEPSGAGALEANYAALSETSDEMYAAIEDTVYTNPNGPAGAAASGSAKRDSVTMPAEVDDVYSKVDKSKKRTDRQTKSYESSYAKVNKKSDRQSLPENGVGPPPPSHLGARPKQKHQAPQQAHHMAERSRLSSDDVDFSDFEVSLVDTARSRVGGPAPAGGPRLNDISVNEAPPASNGSAFDPEYLLGRDVGYETVPYADSVGYETVKPEREEPGYETVPQYGPAGSSHSYLPQTRRLPSFSSTGDPGYESVHPSHDTAPDLSDPGYETLPDTNHGYESVSRPKHQDRESDPGYETVQELKEPGYETVKDRPAVQTEVRYSKVVKKPKAGAVPPRIRRAVGAGYHGSEPELRSANQMDVDIDYETLPDKLGREYQENSESEEGYETIPADQAAKKFGKSVPEYETVRPKPDPGYETIPKTTTDPPSDDAHVEPEYDRLPEDSSELEDDYSPEIALAEEEDLTVESSQSSSLIHMSVVDTGDEDGVRRSSVVVIEHVDMTPVASADQADADDCEDVNTHIFV